jgi:hypothetical protein
MKLIQYLTKRLVERSPETALAVLRAARGELWIARALNKPDSLKWSDVEVPQQVDEFEDLSFFMRLAR